MSRMSRGCQQCRTRKVKCDQGRPTCHRCQKRGEHCTGYRDESSLIFRSENEKIENGVQSRLDISAPLPDAAFAKELRWKIPSNGSSTTISTDAKPTLSSTTSIPFQSGPTTKDPEVWEFFDRFVMYPCNGGSSLGFLEHLPSLFMETNVEHRYALRYAVLAAAHASSSNDPSESTSKQQAFHYYGLALSALSECLKESITEKDDYVLMTVVVLDIFEVNIGFRSIYANHTTNLSSHCIAIIHLH
jgi:hypothetical protein